ncbi:IS1/IS1595 family N-terminal zinc-binding domain-containing protein [Nostoc sp.]
MQCPECESTHNRKNGRKYGKQNYISGNRLIRKAF